MIRDLGGLSLGEAASPDALPPVLRTHDRLFVPALRLPSLLDSSEFLWPDYCRALTAALRQELGLPSPSPVLDERLAIILFGVLPHFVRLFPPTAASRPREEELLAALAGRLDIPHRYHQEAAARFSEASLLRQVEALSPLAVPVAPPQGVVDAAELTHWLHRALKAKLAAREQNALRRLLEERPQDGEAWQARTALLLYVADRGALELDGFGFCRLPRHPGEYWVYRRTGPYALKDYYGRPYLFPDCRVAVATCGRLRPVVLEPYKHPFLRWHGPGQEICLPRDFQPALAFSAANVIAALETGLTTLFYGYNPRRRNGYHSLDRIHPEPEIAFDEYRLAPDDPRIVAGLVEVKNYFA